MPCLIFLGKHVDLNVTDKTDMVRGMRKAIVPCLCGARVQFVGLAPNFMVSLCLWRIHLKLQRTKT